MNDFEGTQINLDVVPFIKEIGRGAKGARDLTRANAESLFGAILDGEVDELQLGALLIGLRIKGESDEELLGFKDALDARTPQLPSQTLNGERLCCQHWVMAR